MSDTSMDDLALTTHDHEEQDEGQSPEDTLSIGSSESDGIAAAFRQMAADKAKRKAAGGNDEDDSDDYCSDDLEQETQYTDPVPEWRNNKYRKARSPLFVKIYNNMAALTPRASDTIRAGLEDIRHIIRSFRKLMVLRSQIETFCILAMRFWKLIATHEAATGNRNKAGTSLNFFLTESLRQVSCFKDVIRIDRSSTVVLRSRYLQHNRAAIWQSTDQLKALIAAGSSLLNLRSDATLPADGTTSFFSDFEVRQNFQHQLAIAIGRLAPMFADVSYLLEMSHLLRNVDFSHDSELVANDGEEIGSTGISQKDLSDALDTLMQSVQVNIDKPVLEPRSGRVGRVWELNATLSIQIGSHEQIFKSPRLHQFLYLMFASFVHVCLWKEACVIGELLIMRLRFLVGEQRHGSGHGRHRHRTLCSALSALSRALVEAGRPLDAMHAADEAVEIFEQVSRGADKDLDGSMLHARLVFQQFQAYNSADNYYLEVTGLEKLTRAIELFRVALSNDPSNTDGRIALAFALDTLARHEYSDGNRTAIREEAIAVYRLLTTEKPEIMLFGEKLVDLLAEHAIRETQYKPADAKSFQFFEEAIERYDNLAKKQSEYRQPLIKTCHHYANRLHEANQDRLALALLEKAINIHDEPDYEPTRAELGGVGGIHHMLLQCAAVCIKLEMYESGMDSIVRVEDLIERKEGGDYSTLLKAVRHHKATCQLMLGHAELSAANLHKTIEAEKRKAARSMYDGLETNERYIQAMGELGAAQCQLGDLDSAIQTGKEAVRLSQGMEAETFFPPSMATISSLTVRNVVFYAATLLKAGQHAEAEQQVDIALKIFAVGCEDLGPVEKTARVIRTQALEAAGRTEEAEAERARADKMPFEGFAHRLGHITKG
ncbi:hypothetical protein A4X09_0g1888 [Tilletia walkeri]|uniref:TPR-like protein n=1 Tax=Tilletia walkeri TaxID=117179 RepID=A0A8X7T6M9_9BASI|nr:hypothetical protein A4X09_0g1888 [Tilletia walkeri]